MVLSVLPEVVLHQRFPMMNNALWILTSTAATIGLVHTVIGPDHYIPFVMMARARDWSRSKTLFITLLCGIGHVLSSVVLGVVGIAFGTALHHLEGIESIRGEIAAWGLIAFGLLYGIWGLKHAYKQRTHQHKHTHSDGTVHNHEHAHLLTATHRHPRPDRTMTTWALFTLFVLGPCEPLIPLLMFPAATESAGAIALVSIVFAVTTISTMLAMVLLVSAGVNRIPLRSIERYTHAIAGAVIALSGLMVQALGV
jgi:nickel/cobalt transporter (NicO) family protein